MAPGVWADSGVVAGDRIWVPVPVTTPWAVGVEPFPPFPAVKMVLVAGSRMAARPLLPL